MQLKDLVKPLDQLSDEELLERLRVSRHNRTVVRPAAESRAKRAAKKGSQTRVSKVESILDELTEAQKLELLRELGGE
jgi:hypothetical protein